jgi:peptide/nickel transport system substrate-binding protein
MGRLTGTLAVVVTTATLIAGCGSAGTPSTGPATVTFASSAPPSLDVAKNYNVADTNIMSMITEPLETLTQDGIYTPLLARKVTQPDKTTIVYDLRPGVTFSDGSPLTAEDVAWSLRHVTADTAQTKNTLEYVKSVEVTGEGQVTVKLSRPDPLTRATLCVVGLIQEKAFAASRGAALGSSGAVPVGTGPYVVDAYTPDQITMKRNGRYWGRKPLPDRLAFKTMSGETKGQLAMRSGEIQGALIADFTSSKDWQRIKGARVYNVPALQSNFLALDVTKPPFDDVHVRRAVAYALDRPGVIAAAFNGQVRPLRSYLPDEIVRAAAPSPTEADAFLRGLPAYPFDLGKAKQELGMSTHAGGLSFPVHFVNELPWTKLAALNLQQNLAKIGVKAEVKPLGRNEWLESIYAGKAKTPTPFNLGTFAPVPNGLDKVVGNGAFNLAKYRTAETRAGLDKLRGDDAERWEATKSLLTSIAEDVPYVPVYQGAQVTVLGGGLVYGRAPSQLDFAQGTNIRLLKAAG